MMILFIMHILGLLESLFFATPRLPVPPPGSLVSDMGALFNTVLRRNVDTDTARRFLHLLPSSLSAHIVSTTCNNNNKM